MPASVISLCLGRGNKNGLGLGSYKITKRKRLRAKNTLIISTLKESDKKGGGCCAGGSG